MAKEATQKKFVYTPEIEQRLRSVYGEQKKACIEPLAKEFGVTTRSVISKLAQLGIYEKEVPAPKKPRDEGPTKKELMQDLQTLGLDPAGLEGATKEAIARIKAALTVKDAA
jgi:hypothetical protein